jgi:hypothetical protein
VHAIIARAQKFWPNIAALLIVFTGCTANHRVLEEVVERVYTVEPGTKVSIHNHDGAILAYGGEPNEIRVRSIKKAYSRERLDQIGLDVSTTPGAVSINTRLPLLAKWGFADRSGAVDYTIVVPETATISALELNSGEVLLDSIRGPEVRARLNDGRVFVRNCFTKLDFAVKRGTFTLTYDWWEQKEFSAKVNVGQGNAWLFFPTESAFRLIAEAAQGRIANDFNNVPLPADASDRGMRFDQLINGGGSALIQVQVGAGDVRITEANL